MIACRHRRLALGLLLVCGFVRAQVADEVQVLADVEWVRPDGSTQRLELPDELDGQPARRRYRWQFTPVASQSQRGIYFSGLAANARLSLNGQPLFDRRGAGNVLPRRPDWPVLVSVPDALWRSGPNLLELEAVGSPGLSISRVEIGPVERLAAHQRARLAGTVVGPLVAAAVVGTLGLFMLLLWARRHETLTGTFGLAALGWGLHDTWSAWPSLWLPQPHNAVWSHVLFTFWVAMVLVFCLRYADWRLPRVERALWWLAPVSAPVLYAGSALGVFALTSQWWRLGLIVIVALGVLAMGRAIRRRRDLDGALIAATGALSLGFGLHDWLGVEGDNNYVLLVPYAGLAFVLVVARMLVNRFVQALRELEQLNSGLEQRVAAQHGELRRALDEMRQARDAAQAAVSAKSRFLAAASHDLRQPAHALGLYLATLSAQALAPAQADLVQRMSRSLAALDALFNRLLDISRIDAGAVVPQPRAFELAPLLQRLADELAPQAETQGLRLALRIGLAGRPAVVRTDPLLLERVLRNLLGNALRYTRSGGVLLALRLRQAGGVPRWRIEVWDSGIGIAADQQSRVFDEFYQVGNRQRERNAGLGLGLSIVQRLLALLQLPLTLHSRPGQGSCFAITLPRADDGPSAPDAVSAGPTGVYLASLQGLRIGLLEDDAEVRHAFAGLLRSWGCEVVNGADAEELLQDLGGGAVPRAMVLDYRLRDGCTGLDELRRLQSHWGRVLPALVLTGESGPEALREINASGHAWRPKPVAPEQLREWLDAVAWQGPGETRDAGAGGR